MYCLKENQFRGYEDILHVVILQHEPYPIAIFDDPPLMA